MCGIFGFITIPSNYPTQEIRKCLERIAVLSESRGKDSSGIAFRQKNKGKIGLVKGDIPISQLINSGEYKAMISESLANYKSSDGFCAFGHSRLVTNGTQLKESNNQPVVKDGIVIIHNGIIVNVDELWKSDSLLKREFNIDTEIVPALLRRNMDLTPNLSEVCNHTFNMLVGTFSLAILINDINQFVLATNNGSLYYITDNKNFITFASEAYFLNTLIKEMFLSSIGSQCVVKQLPANTGIIIGLADMNISHFEFPSNKMIVQMQRIMPLKIIKYNVQNKSKRKEIVIDPAIYINRSKERHYFDLLETNNYHINKLLRCNKCLLPETFPYIVFDKNGTCNFCHNYSPHKILKTLDELKSIVEPYKRKDAKADCIVPFSGGRDSTYSLHIIKKELGLNPIAFTYDWGMVTDLARRNIARVCGKLGVENIIVSADIQWKRENIKKNVKAWLKNPKLGMIPLFMAGDKYFFYYCNQVKKQTGIDLNIWGVNPLENTEFKTGFAGLPPKFNKRRIYSLSIINQFKLFGFIGSNIIKNPSYINQSVLDSLGSFAARYIAPKKDYYHLFDYYRWDENEINQLIQNEYKWETAIDTKSTWRIGDGTASFYNYIYYTVAGFSENDTFRSNQIREGMLTREKALQLAEEDNIPRYETLRWYLEIIGLDFENVIKTVNEIPKLYPI